MSGGRDDAQVAVGLQDRKHPAAEKKNDDDDQEPDDWRAPVRRNTETARRPTAARPEAVAGRWVRRSPQEVGFMMGKPLRNVKVCSMTAGLDT